ncbi:UDP-N-acetylglucosamine 2-epimerase (non-hydrolyzing), partial [candidate division KSB1 bacterium]
AFVEISERIPIVFPMHPRTQKLTRQLPKTLLETLSNRPILITEPVGYLDFLYLEQAAKLVLTDSGGIQEETTYLNIPCLTLRPNTERPITIREGTNRLVPLEKETIVKYALDSLNEVSKSTRPIKYWDGQAAKRIVEYLRKRGKVFN